MARSHKNFKNRLQSSGLLVNSGTFTNINCNFFICRAANRNPRSFLADFCWSHLGNRHNICLRCHQTPRCHQGSRNLGTNNNCYKQLVGPIFFGEAKLLGAEKVIRTVLAISFLLLSTLAIVMSSKGEKKFGNVKTGLLAALVIGIFSGSFFVPMRLSPLPPAVSFLPMSIGTVLLTSFLLLIKKQKVLYDTSTTARMILAGIILGGGNFMSLLTIQKLGVAQGFPLTQMALIVNTLWGVFFFKEVATTRGKLFIALSIVIAIVGILTLNSARP